MVYNMRNSTVYLVIAVIVVAVIAGVAGAYLGGFIGGGGKKVLKVGTSPDFPPFEYVDKEGNIVGIDIDLIKSIAAKQGYEVEIVSIDFDGLIPALQNGQIDVIAAGMTITEEREQKVDFTIPYWDADQAILVKKGSNLHFDSLNDLVGKTVGVQSGTTGEWLIDDFINQSGEEITVKRYPSFVLAVTDLVNGRTDAVIVDTPVAAAYAKKYDVEVSATIKTGEQYGLAVRKGNTELLNELNSALEEFLKSQEWKDIISNYFGQS